MNIKFLTLISGGFILSFNLNAENHSLTSCKGPVDPSKRQFLIGYGSLLLEQSKLKTEEHVKENHPIEVKGYERGWIAQTVDTQWGTTYLGAIKKSKAYFNGAYFELDAKAIQNFDIRERTYCRVLVDPKDLTSLENKPLPVGQYWMYVSKNAKLKPNQSHPITQFYVDVFLNGCLEIEKKFGLKNYAKSCITQTHYWSEHWVNDRVYPRHPHINEPHAHEIDQLIKQLLPTLTKKIKIE
jgi:hypothetical protein